jgi:hypothetical protein
VTRRVIHRFGERPAAGAQNVRARQRYVRVADVEEQALTSQDFTRRATGFADSYSQWAADAAQNGRADLAAQYASTADHWAEVAAGGR